MISTKLGSLCPSCRSHLNSPFEQWLCITCAIVCVKNAHLLLLSLNIYFRLLFLLLLVQRSLVFFLRFCNFVSFLFSGRHNSVFPQLSNFGSEVELNDVRETIQQLLRWGWKYNKNLEEQAAQLHMLTGWSLIVEVHCYLSLMMLFEIRFWLL